MRSVTDINPLSPAENVSIREADLLGLWLKKLAVDLHEVASQNVPLLADGEVQLPLTAFNDCEEGGHCPGIAAQE